MISSFFASNPGVKRPSSPIDLTSDPEDRRPTKKARVDSGDGSGPSDLSWKDSPKVDSAASSSVPKERRYGKALVQKFRFSPEEAQELDQPESTSAEEKRRKEARRQAFRDKLIGRPFPFDREKEAEALLDASPDSDEETDDGERDGNVVEELRERFAAKGRNSGDSVSQAKGKKKGEEIGPSGLPYTPLEKQVRRY